LQNETQQSAADAMANMTSMAPVSRRRTSTGAQSLFCIQQYDEVTKSYFTRVRQNYITDRMIDGRGTATKIRIGDQQPSLFVLRK
jgi:hypothetical protein